METLLSALMSQFFVNQLYDLLDRLGDVQGDVLPPVSLLLGTLLWRQRWAEVTCR